MASFLNREKALLFNSGFQLNCTLLKTLSNENTLFFLDKQCHRSLIEGASAANGKTFRFRHNDLNHLEELLKKHRAEGDEAWIVTESLFSMEGDRAPLNALVALKHQYGAFLIVDDAHAFGTLGDSGKGLTSSNVDLVIGACGKALGGSGGFVTGDAILIDFVLNFSPGFLFTTALPPAVVGGLIEGVKLLPSLTQERERLKQNGDLLRKELRLPAGDHIIPFYTGTPENALLLSKSLRKGGWDVPAVRPPTVAPMSSLLRFNVTATHTEADILSVTKALKNEVTL